MVYLDYSATTVTNKEVLDTFVKCSNEYIGNPNSLHKLGVASKNLIDKATTQIIDLLKLNDAEVIYTSGSTESNNLALKGICNQYKNRGKHIITTPLEHSSIYGPLKDLEEEGYIIDYVKLDSNGLVDLNNLNGLLTDDTILVSICTVNSEIGLLQPIEEIGKIVKKYPRCIFHTDATQAIGKVNVDLNCADLISFSAHKFFGIKGIGVLIKKNNIELKPQISGGKSTTIYRSGTPSLPLIVSISKALRLSLIDIDNKYNKVKELNEYLRKALSKYDKVVINSNNYSIPHILNISILGVKPETMLHALEEYEIYISTKSACSSANSISKPVYALTNDEELARRSLRISIASITTKDEIDYFLEKFDVCYNRLTNLR